MAIEWMNDFFIPAIEFVFIIGIFGSLCFIITRAVSIKYSRRWKWFLKYKMPFIKKQYPSNIIEWCLQTYEKGYPPSKAKMHLLINEIDDNKINETLYIYEQVLNEIYTDSKNLKGGKNDRIIKGSYSENEGKLPKI